MCNKYDETIDHIVSGCPELAQTEYTHRHDKAAAYIHWKVCHNCNIKTSEEVVWPLAANSYRKRGCHDIMGHANTHRQENNSQQTRYSD